MNRFFRLSLAMLLFLAACTPGKNQTEADLREADYHFLMGSSYLEEGNATLALQELLLAEKLDGKRTDIHAALGRAFMIKGAYAQAEEHYLEAYELSGGEAKYQNNLGALYLSMERYQEAASAFRTAATDLLFSNPEVAWTGLGVAHFQMNDIAAAEQYYRRALEENAAYFQPYYRLGVLYFAQDRPFEAAEAFRKVVKLVPGFVDGYYRLGLAEMQARNTTLARDAFENVVRLAPESEQARLATDYLNILE